MISFLLTVVPHGDVCLEESKCGEGQGDGVDMGGRSLQPGEQERPHLKEVREPALQISGRTF